VYIKGGSSHSPSYHRARPQAEAPVQVGPVRRTGVTINICAYDAHVVREVLKVLETKVDEAVSRLSVPYQDDLTAKIKQDILNLQSGDVWINIGEIRVILYKFLHNERVRLHNGRVTILRILQLLFYKSVIMRN